MFTGSPVCCNSILPTNLHIEPNRTAWGHDHKSSSPRHRRPHPESIASHPRVPSTCSSITPPKKYLISTQENNNMINLIYRLYKCYINPRYFRCESIWSMFGTTQIVPTSFGCLQKLPGALGSRASTVRMVSEVETGFIRFQCPNDLKKHFWSKNLWRMGLSHVLSRIKISHVSCLSHFLTFVTSQIAYFDASPVAYVRLQ